MFRFLITSLASVWLVACVPASFDDPIFTMLDREAGYPLRRSAAEQARTQMPHESRYVEALHKLVWQTGYPSWQRRWAIDQLVHLDRSAFREVLAKRIDQIQDWDTLRHILDLAVDQQWRDFAGTAVLSYVQFVEGMPDHTRPERAAIQSLYPHKRLERVVYEVFINAGGGASYRQRVAAWELLNRLVDEQGCLSLLSRAPGDDHLVRELTAAAEQLHVLPRNREGIIWLSYLSDPRRAALWGRMADAVGKLSPAQRWGLGLRHLPVVLQLDDAVLALDKEALLNRIRLRIRATPHYSIPPREGARTSPPQRLDDWIDRLCWADLATIDLLARSLHDHERAALLFDQADADLHDTRTEYGGVIDWHDSEYVFQPYEPGVRRHDRVFYPSPAMIEHMYTAIAHYHFHAQDHHNGEYAGPGRGDLGFARRMNFSCVVLTFIDRDTINADYYQPDGVVVDLGSITR